MPEFWQTNTLILGNPIVGLSMLTGMLSLLLAFLVIYLYQLERRLRRRDHDIKALLLTDPLTGLHHQRPLNHQAHSLLGQPHVGNIKDQCFQKALMHAIDRRELRVRYQPIVDLCSSQPVGFEALVRWQHPDRGLLLPGDFLPLAEEIGLAIAIDRWVMQAACQQLAAWQRQTKAFKPALSINLTSTHLADPDLVNYIQLLLAHYQLAPSQLNLEVTESVMIMDPNRAIDTLRKIKALGISVSLDDFGTGYSSLCYLHQLPADVLKIDRSFVSGLGKVPSQCDVIIKAILDLAAELNIRVIAEGIERDEQRQQLQLMNCSYGQGNLFSKPIEAACAQGLLA